MNHASLFSGIGGAEVAASMMGWKNLFHCEIQEFPRKVLDYWFPNSESYEDITKTDFTKWGVRSMFSQEDSHANLSPSQVEERERTITVTSGLRCFERYGRYTPTWVVGENVAGIKTMVESCQVTQMGRTDDLFEENHLYREESRFTLDKICADLEAEGYSVQPIVIPACAIGAPHRRDRVWIIAHTQCNGHSSQEYGNQRARAKKSQKGKDRPQSRLRRYGSGTASSYTNGMRQRKWANKQKPINWCCRTDSPQDRWRDFPTQSPVCRGNDGIPFDVDSLTISFPKWRQESIKAYGNAWVPQVAYEIFKAIEVEEKKTTK